MTLRKNENDTDSGGEASREHNERFRLKYYPSFARCSRVASGGR